MKLILFIALLLAVSLANDSEYTKIVQDFTKAMSTGDQEYLTLHVHPLAEWSPPQSKLIRGRQEIVKYHSGLPQGHQFLPIPSEVEFFRAGNTLHVFGLFDYLQNAEVTHSGRFQFVIEFNRTNDYQLTHGIWHFDGKHLKQE